jgi:hypothetical protein
MAKRTVPREPIPVSEIPDDVIGTVVLADLAQIEADAATHPDALARERIIKAVTRLRYIAQGAVSADVIEPERLVMA